jgi:hypothetical protein
MNDPLLRPRSAVEIIDAAFALYRANFGVLATLALVLLGPFEVIGVLVGGDVGSLISNLSGLLGPIVVGATVAVVSDAMHDRPISIASAFAQIAGRWGTLVLVSFAQGVLVIIGLIVLVVPGLIALVWTFAAPMAVVVERVDQASAALGRARQLARGQFWHILRTLALAWVVVFVLLVAVAIGAGLIGQLFKLNEDMTGFLGAWVFILLMPIIGTASSILYFDLRIRTEAYDIERLAATVGDGGATHTP